MTNNQPSKGEKENEDILFWFNAIPNVITTDKHINHTHSESTDTFILTVERGYHDLFSVRYRCLKIGYEGFDILNNEEHGLVNALKEMYTRYINSEYYKHP